MKIRCPIPQCSYENLSEAVHCSSCGANLEAYSQLHFMPDYHFNQGLMLSQNGHFQQAEQFLHAALLFKPSDVEAMLLLAHVQALQGHNVAAVATFERAQERGTRDPRIEDLMIVLQEVLGKAQVSVPPPAARAPSANQPAKSPPSRAKQRQQKRKRGKRGRRK